MDIKPLRDHLQDVDQHHVLTFWETLEASQQQQLAGQLAELDLALIERTFRQVGHGDPHDWRTLASQAQSPLAIRLDQQCDAALRRRAVAAGTAALEQGTVAAILVAGGQGTRLGFPHPKGFYPIGPLSGRSLYQWHIDQLRGLARRHGRPVPLWLMTSPATDVATRQLLAERQRFGLAEDQLAIFCQGTMPAVDRATGRLLLEQPDSLALSPDGHGGMLAALARSGGLRAMQQRGVRHVYYFQVDNPLVNLCDPLLLGFHLLHQSEMTTQVICKQRPLDKVGNVVVVDGRMQVIEYSDLPDELADRRGDDGQPIFWAGSIAVHVFALDFLLRAAQSDQMLPLHRALKQVPYVDLPSGRRVEPSQPNAIKFERFIFDLMPSARNPLVVEVEAADQFEPLKNASGAAKHSPETVRRALVAKHRKWLRQAGAQVSDSVDVEIHPLFALDADELATKVVEGERIETARYFDEPPEDS